MSLAIKFSDLDVFDPRPSSVFEVSIPILELGSGVFEKAPTITAAGRNLFAMNAASTFVMSGFSIALGTGLYEPEGDETALQAEVVRISAADSSIVANDQIRVSATLGNGAANGAKIGEVGIYYGATLVAILSKPSTPMFAKIANVDIPLKFTVDISVVETASIPDLFPLYKGALAAPGGAGLVGFIPAGGGAVARTVEAKQQDILSTADYDTAAKFDAATAALTNGIDAPIRPRGQSKLILMRDLFARRMFIDEFFQVGDPDDTASFNRAFASGRKKFRGTDRKYVLSGPITASQTGISFQGDNQYTTLLQQNLLNSATILNTGSFNQFEDFAVLYNGTPTAGATALYSSGAGTQLERFIVRNAHIGLDFNTGSAQMAKNFQVLDYEAIGLFAHEVNDVFASDFILNAGNALRGTLGGIRLVNQTEAIMLSKGDVLLGVYSMATDGVYSAGSRPAYNNFTDMFFDSAAKGVSLEKIVATSFVGCWFSGGRTDAGYPGVVIGQTDGLVFHASRFINNGGHGAFLTNRAKRTVLTGNTFDSNSVTAGVGVAHGLAIEGGATDFVVQANIAHNGLLAGQQGYGILLNAGASDRYVIADNLVSGNASGGVIDGGSGVNKRVENNY